VTAIIAPAAIDVAAGIAGFGAVVAGVDLGRTADDAARWRAALALHGVLVFPGQTIDDAGFVRFLTRLGPMVFTPGETPLPDYPMLNAVSNVGRATPPRSVFHTDSSYLGQPPAYTALRAVTVPRSGGATLFSDQYAAADGLPPRCRATLVGRTARHRVTGLAGQDAECRQPLLRRHPVSGRSALYLTTPERCADIDGLTAAASARVIDLLYRRSIRPGALYRHDWRAGDVVVWDDRCTMHRADHLGTVGDRVLHRGMVGGETPIAGT